MLGRRNAGRGAGKLMKDLNAAADIFVTRAGMCISFETREIWPDCGKQSGPGVVCRHSGRGLTRSFAVVICNLVLHIVSRLE